MTLQSGSLGSVYFGPQTAKGTVATTAYGFKGNMFDLAPQQMVRNIGQLVGGTLLPGGNVKTAAFGGGSAVMPPPLENYIGWLMYAFAGSCSSSGSGPYVHTYPSGADSSWSGHYLTGLRTIPGDSTRYEQLEDLVPTRLQLGITPGEFTTMRMDFLGRTISSPANFSGFSLSAAENPADSCPIGCKGGLTLGDTGSLEYASAATLELANVIPDIRQVLVVGSYYPVDFPVLTRNITLNYTLLYGDSVANTLYAAFYWSGTAWTPVQHTETLDVYVQSPSNISGESVPYELRVYGNNVQWNCDPIRLAGGELVGMAVTGTVADATSGHDWRIRIRNNNASYTWPT